MDQKRIKAISLFILFQNIVSLHGEVITPEEGDKVQIKCESPQKGFTVMWLRVVDNSVDFIASYHSNGIRKPETILNTTIYSESKMKTENILSIKRFNSQRDRGVYICAVLTSNTLKFGKVTRLQRVVSVTPAAAVPATNAKTPSTPMVCTCNSKTEDILSIWDCSPIILGSLACGYGFIIFLFVITIVCCNRLRTRRCPHHYKRQKQRRKVEGGRAMEN
ncbi:T-cell surface glycoprotein CD8 alpha chain isoform X2 [Gadus chalcogrammus]|uniref:T-cell surface glycoprotein CD8 alpha chain isoform X2 n=1 Tax=Gadus chalcogrammus TaxID=1042646 RepID=UPI0024C494A8|nr:T-cell surface glycoprotein CD8 alpha chain isoform X2 [Gadus chalcogrammus]